MKLKRSIVYKFKELIMISVKLSLNDRKRCWFLHILPSTFPELFLENECVFPDYISGIHNFCPI